jgi:alanine racemase
MGPNQYTVRTVAEIAGGELVVKVPHHTSFEELLTDSRKLIHPEVSLFFALKGERHDGHRFIPDLVKQGVINFVISEFRPEFESLEANFVVVHDSLQALQQLAASHRRHFAYPVIAITGSNGKTIVKEWLYQLLRSDYNIVRSPKSYNSQIGVPLSVWQMNDDHQLAIFEAGISCPNEMANLEKIIHPTVGVFTNIGAAHEANFSSREEKVKEKLQLFDHVENLVYCKDYPEVSSAIDSKQFHHSQLKRFSWSRKTKADLQIARVTKKADECEIQAVFDNRFISIRIPFTDEASIENAIHCWAVLLLLGIEDAQIEERMHFLSPVAMRLEMKTGINHCSIINDSYNSDLGSLTIALDFLGQQKQHERHTLILSDILQSGKNEVALYNEVADLLLAKKVSRLFGIGAAISRQRNLFRMPATFFETTEDFLKAFPEMSFRDEAVLLKGARPFGFEQIVKLLQQKAHETVLEVNINALVHNLNYYRSRLRPTTKMMAMVKATSYGSGSHEIASVLQFHHVDYLAVAYTDEGVELRKAGITLPIMVMNPEVHSFDAMIRYRLEPEIYNFRLLNQLNESLKKHTGEPFRIHIKLDTGMHRLGFEEADIAELIVRIKNNKQLQIQSIFTHLAASDEAEHDGFTSRQIERFTTMSDQIRAAFDYPILRHILNSSGILRFSEAQYEMVRLGIGLYGFASTSHEQQQLQHVATLRTTISQIKSVPANETVGYSRKGIVKRESSIATVPIGYADGISRRLSNGVGKMLVNGIPAPIVGNVCMDMCMLDITDVPAKEGDEVIVFGPELPVSEMAKWIGTIPYEILTGISQRVKRVYFQE